MSSVCDYYDKYQYYGQDYHISVYIYPFLILKFVRSWISSWIILFTVKFFYLIDINISYGINIYVVMFILGLKAVLFTSYSTSIVNSCCYCRYLQKVCLMWNANLWAKVPHFLSVGESLGGARSQKYEERISSYDNLSCNL